MGIEWKRSRCRSARGVRMLWLACLVILPHVDMLTFTNPQTEEDFRSAMLRRGGPTTTHCRFGLAPLDEIRAANVDEYEFSPRM